MKKFFSIIKIILGAIGALVGFILLAGSTAPNSMKPPSRMPFISGMAVWLVLTIGMFLIYDKITTKKENRRQAAYKEKYISELVIEDSFFGKMTFCLDRNHNMLESSEIHLPPFGADAPDSLYVTDYDENDREKILHGLREIYNHKDEILELIYPGLLEIATDYGETDSSGNPYTMDELRRVTAIYSITVCNSKDHFFIDLDCYTVSGTLELGGHSYVASVDFVNKNIQFDLEG